MDFKKLYTYTKDLTILYVEDDLHLRQETTEILNECFARVDTAENGKIGLEKYQQRYQESARYYDIVLTDINMPTMDGIQMSTEIKAIYPKQSIIVISAYNDTPYLTKLLDLGVDKFLQKPLKTKQLINSLYQKSKEIFNEIMVKEYHQKLVNLTLDLEEKVKERTIQLERQLTYDALTGLYSRHILSENLKSQSYDMLCLVDIDRLQFINDLYGADVGNQVIQKIANILSQISRAYGCDVYRTSGDEFALTHQNMPYEKALLFLTKLSEKTTNLHLYIEDIAQEVNVDATIGLALKDEKILTNADIALKHAKKYHHQYVVYNKALNSLDKMKETIEWKNKIEHAIQSGNIIPVFQPIVNKEGEILKYETLMRLRLLDDEDEKLISPYFFLETATRTKLYSQLSYLIIEAALNTLRSYPITLSINLTYHDFTNPEIIGLLHDRLKEGALGSRMIFEIVESENIENYNTLQEFIQSFRPYGVKIAIDDFGAGFSSFQHIVETSPDYIKIDGSLVKDIDTDLNSLTIIKAIMQFSKELGIKVIAEFVHNEDVLDILRSLGVDEYQGFYFYEPSQLLINESEAIMIEG